MISRFWCRHPHTLKVRHTETQALELECASCRRRFPITLSDEALTARLTARLEQSRQEQIAAAKKQARKAKRQQVPEPATVARPTFGGRGGV